MFGHAFSIDCDAPFVYELIGVTAGAMARVGNVFVDPHSFCRCDIVVR
jgi:hypothetical protein